MSPFEGTTRYGNTSLLSLLLLYAFYASLLTIYALILSLYISLLTLGF